MQGIIAANAVGICFCLQTIYCNLEGFQFIDERRVVVTSDKAKRYQVRILVAAGAQFTAAYSSCLPMVSEMCVWPAAGV